AISRERGGEHLDSREVHNPCHALPLQTGTKPERVERFFTPKSGTAATKLFDFTPERPEPRRAGRGPAVWRELGAARRAPAPCPGTRRAGWLSRSSRFFHTGHRWVRCLDWRAKI